jgi:uncharacterized Rmd1/YagE family protein
MPEWAATLLAAALVTVGATFGFVIAQDRRITRLEERVANIGKQLTQLPKRRGD